MRTVQVAVIGGGAAGVLTVVALLGTPVHDVVLVDPSPGRGLAYGPAEACHLLNSPARAMSAYEDEPTHFLEWCQGTDPSSGPGDFISRARYGDYLAETLGVEEAAGLGRLSLLRERAVGVARHPGRGMVVTTASGERVHADHVVLALGQGRARRLSVMEAVRDDPRYIEDPWAPGAFDRVPSGEPVLLVGTGLTAIDVAFSLSERGVAGPLVAVSRHGLLPREHTRGAAEAVRGLAAPEPTASLAGLTRRVRALAASVPDWRAVVDLMRPSVDAYWRGLGPDGRERFVRHLARYWEIHRHRMAPAVAERVARLRATGALRIEAAAIVSVSPAPDALSVRLGGGETPRRFGAIVNCTGRDRLTVTGDPLVNGLLADGLAAPGPGGNGLGVALDGAVLDAAGHPNPALWTLGPPRFGHLWETTAVPEIRYQAKVLADHLVTGAPLGV
ncbi:FAD/NAD(P)-binding protein [Phytomonospora endophytica]|uniref:Putative NAD(P)/FAD-binding protein YdhS n=1 Tax=Phytomonospora endophytica TaxID=714109 RepID=A0A841FKC4_9ACTN|nr:FAD/NAD(P)-binding protein [Phytomonospora endophytica]MBB6033089.1 putative NAD(P)/FAD-binding protein YdhS [Phytomonospora endophytica]